MIYLTVARVLVFVWFLSTVILDSTFTVIGLEKRVALEGNSTVRFFLEKFGIVRGMVIYSSLEVAILGGLGWTPLDYNIWAFFFGGQFVMGIKHFRAARKWRRYGA